MNAVCGHGLRMSECPNAECFAKAGGEHGPAYEPFDGALVTETRRLAIAAERGASALEGIRDILRGRDATGAKVPSPITAVADAVLKHLARPTTSTTQPTPPPTQRTPSQTQTSTSKRVATESEMSGDKGDPKIRFDPKRDWTDLGKPSFKGRKCSECDPAFLDVYADGLDYFASKALERLNAGGTDEKDKKEAHFGALDAARARGWAARIRARGYAPPPAPPADDWD